MPIFKLKMRTMLKYRHQLRPREISLWGGMACVFLEDYRIDKNRNMKSKVICFLYLFPWEWVDSGYTEWNNSHIRRRTAPYAMPCMTHTAVHSYITA